MTPQEREVMQMALDALQESKPIDINDPTAFYRSAHAIEAMRVALATEQIECTPMPPVDDDGWCEWSYPKHKGYLMQCCDCGLVHEVEFHVLGNIEPQEDGSSNGEVMEAGYQVGLRMRRHSEQPEQEPVAQIQVAEDYYPHVVFLDGVDTTSLDQKFLYTAPPQQPEQEPVAEVRCDDGGILTAKFLVRDLPLFAKLYAAPPQREWVGLTDEEYATLMQQADYDAAKTGSVFQNLRRAIEAKLREKNT